MKRIVMTVTVLAMLLVACGTGSGVGDGGPVSTTTTTTPDQSTTTTTAPDGSTTTTTVPATRFVDIYLVQEGQFAAAVQRAIPDTPQVATNAIKALLEGPTPAEESEDLSTAIPPATLLLGLTIEDGLAVIDLSREFESGGGSFAMISRLAQIVYTLTQFPTVDAVSFMLDGQPVTVFSNEGLVLDEPVVASDYWSALPLTPTDTVQRWEQSDLPDIDGYQARLLRNVVLVAEDDVLNVRTGPGVDNEILGGLAPNTTVVLMGDSERVGSSTWVEILTPRGNGWVNSFFLTEWQFPSDVLTSDLEALLDRTAAIIAADGDLSEVASSRGIFVSHHYTPIRFRPSELESVLKDPTTYKWGSNALNLDDPLDAQEIPSRTFSEAIADSFVSVWTDEDVQVAVDEPINGGNGRLPDWALPVELKGFHYVSMYDPGDNEEYGGLDWVSWHVSIEYEDGDPKIVAMTIDQWSP